MGGQWVCVSCGEGQRPAYLRNMDCYRSRYMGHRWMRSAHMLSAWNDRTRCAMEILAPSSSTHIHGNHGYPWHPWISMASMDIHGIHGNPWHPWISMASMDIHGIHGYPWHPWISMDAMNTHGCHGYPWM